MSDTQTFVDAEAAVKAWLAATIAAAAGRVFLAVNSKGEFPQLAVLRVGGGPQDGEAPVDQARIQIDAWHTNRKAAADLAYLVVTACRELAAGTPMDTIAVCFGARVLSNPIYRTSSDDERARRYRYTLDVEFALRAA